MILPTHHHPHDARWITDQLSKLPVHLVEKACNGYDAVWLGALVGSQPDDRFALQAARTAANTRLRQYINRVLAV